eukprot:3299270-Prymnesium_polylepis.1
MVIRGGVKLALLPSSRSRFCTWAFGPWESIPSVPTSSLSDSLLARRKSDEVKRSTMSSHAEMSVSMSAASPTSASVCVCVGYSPLHRPTARKIAVCCVRHWPSNWSIGKLFVRLPPSSLALSAAVASSDHVQPASANAARIGSVLPCLAVAG